MKIKLAVLFALLCIVTVAVHADTIDVFLAAQPFGSPPNGERFTAFITNPDPVTVFLSDLIEVAGTAIPSPPTSNGTPNSDICFPILGGPGQPSACNAAGELPLLPGAHASYFLGLQGFFGLAPGVHTETLFVYGGFTGANDFSLLGRDTATFTVPAVPEPSTLLLFGTGLLGVVGAVRRKLLG